MNKIFIVTYNDGYRKGGVSPPAKQKNTEKRSDWRVIFIGASLATRETKKN
jgi:hypothetical protein